VSETPPAEDDHASPRCPRCGAPLRAALMPPGTFGLAGDACVDCSDSAPSRQQPWACPACGMVVLLDPAGRS
jgi:hypothetical protein